MDNTIRELRLKLQHKQTKKIAWQIIQEYFMGWHFEDCKEELDDILLGALTSDQIESSEKGKDRFNMILFCEHTKLLIQAVELLHKKKQAKKHYNMNSTSHEDFTYCFCEYKLQYQILTEEILNVVECEKIFLLATTITSQRVVNLFLTPSISPKLISHYHVLVVVPRAGKSPNMEIQDKIEGKLQHSFPTTTIILDTDQFSNWIKEQHPFATALGKGTSLLYNGKENEIGNFDKYDNREPQIKFESMFAQGRNKAQEFLAAADLFRIREQNKMAAFMLHQSLEQILRSLLIIMTGLEITTHNLDKLLRFCSMFYSRFPEIFKSYDGKSQKAFQLLQKAYIDARYKDDYYIGTPDLIFLQEKIHTVLNLYEHIIKEFIKKLELTQ